MKIRIWQAFASNNSGSYTIVGSFQDAEVARDVVEVLAKLAAEHTRWREQSDAAQLPPEDAPLAVFARHEGLTWSPEDGMWDDWPEYGEHNIPSIWSIDHQVFVHVNYTVSMPPTFGAYFYKRGGRVSCELVHTHRPLACTFQVWWPWQGRVQAQVDRQREELVRALTAADGPLVQGTSREFAPAWATGKHLEGDLAIGCVFEDLAAGTRAVAALITAHGAKHSIKVSELESDNDPFAHLRPCSV